MKIPNWSELIFLISDKSGLKDYQIAQRLGVAPSTVNNIKQVNNDPRWITGERILRLAKFYKIDVVYK